MKEEIRSKIKELRNQLQFEVQQKKSEIIVSVLISTLENIFVDKGSYKKIGLYYPIGSEVDIRDLYDYLWRRDVTTSLPRTYGKLKDFDMEFFLFNETTILNKNGPLVEPDVKAELQIPEILIIPIVAFDSKLQRIGSGKGYYDRYLKKHPDVLKIGVAYSEQKVPQIKSDYSDIPMDLIITDQGVFR